MTDEQLRNKLSLLRKGDRTAFEEIYTALKTPLFTIILRVMQDNALSEDILQEVFVKLYQSPPKPPIKKPRAYIFQMARNLAIDGIRKQPQFADIDEIENMVYLPVADWAQKLDIENAIKTLSLVDCQIVTLHINGKLKFREIADIMGIPLGTVLWKYQKSIGKLRLILDGGAI